MQRQPIQHRELAKSLPCAVCGLETSDHSRWFLVVENRWLDHLKVLSWHPLLAQQEGMLSVCGRQHLRTLMVNWLDRATLELRCAPQPPIPIISECPAETGLNLISAGRVMGELAVHREALSSAWTGSPAALEYILDALSGRVDPSPHKPAALPPVMIPAGCTAELAVG